MSVENQNAELSTRKKVQTFLSVFASDMKKERKNRGWTLDVLATECSTTAANLCRYEKGHYGGVSGDLFLTICDVLNLDPRNYTPRFNKKVSYGE